MNSNFVLSGFADEIANDLTTQMTIIEKLDMHYIEMRGVDGDNLIFHQDAKVKEIKNRLDAHGIKLSALGSPLGKIGITDNFTTHFEQFKRAIEIAHIMETKNIRVFSFYIPKEANLVDYQGKVFDQLGQFVDYAKANDAVLLHENEKGIYGEMAAECKKLMDTFGGEHFQAVFDFANFVQCKQDTVEAYEILKQHVKYVHVKDALWESGAIVPAGNGDGNVEKILRLLEQNDFRGFLSIEPHLFDFQGFEKLENGSQKLVTNSTSKMTGAEAFTLAHDSLVKLLNTK